MTEPAEDLAALERPLHSVARDDFRMLPRVREFGQSIRTIAERLNAGETARLASNILALFESFDALPLPVKRERVARALSLLAEHRQGRLFEDGGGEEAAPREKMPVPSSAPPSRLPRQSQPELLDTAGSPSEREVELASRSAKPIDPDQALAGLATEVTYVKGVGPKAAVILARLGIRSVEDLLWHLPARYEDRRDIRAISELLPGESALFTGEVQRAGRTGRRVFEAVISDGTGKVHAKWFHFNDRRLREQLRTGRRGLFYGEVKAFRGALQITHPEIEWLADDETPETPRSERLVPIYPLTEGLHAKRLRTIVENGLAKYGDCLVDGLDPVLPEIMGEGLPPLPLSMRELHAPDPENDAARLNAKRTLYHRRVRIHEAFFLQLGLAVARAKRTRDATQSFEPEPELLAQFLGSLPWKLTGAQERVITEIAGDLSRPHPMNRLLQGDVGSGKTIVAAAAAAIVIAGGGQAALMAPTEILAEQHFRNLKALLDPLGVRLALLTGSQRLSTVTAKPERVHYKIEHGGIDLVVGTHALIQERVRFSNLGLAIIDEQHRFGVAQRAELRAKAPTPPHVLVMTATPIPRTLTLTIYGDLDVSLLDEMPPGRTPIATRIFPEKDRRDVWARVKAELKAGRQAYVVYPLVAESEKLDLRNAVAAAEELQNGPFREFGVGIVHGQMKPEEKERVLRRFREGEIDLLVSTTVIEVGIDVPNATVMVVEHAERFGLSQLHQLRGRVGRGAKQGHCFLIAGAGVKDETLKRLKVMEETTDGFRVSEEDLRQRGPGEFMGTRQHGLPDFKVLDLVRDQQLLARCRQAANTLLGKDPDLAAPELRTLRKILAHRWESRAKLIEVG